jgi:D-glycero-D-manno-heptose 1,7-bisphosphate phosphatase
MLPALFLDRDGIINVDHDYVHRPENFIFVDGIFELCAAAQAAGLVLVVITNQSGIGRGYYTEEDFARLSTWMVDQFAARGVSIARVYFSPHYAESADERYRAGLFDRKPNPGMLLRAQRDFDLDLPRSILIGDRLSDLEAGRRAGLGTLCLLPHPDEPIDPDALSEEGILIAHSLPDLQTRLFGVG